MLQFSEPAAADGMCLVLAGVLDTETDRETFYYYDLLDRLSEYREAGDNYDHRVRYGYDTENNLSKQMEKLNSDTYTTTYTYDSDNRITAVTNDSGTAAATDDITVAYSYDGFGRVHSQQTKKGSTAFLTRAYTFSQGKTGTQTTGQVASLTVTGSGYSAAYTYEYDANGNITRVTSGGKSTRYTYDNQNQLIREDNQAAGKIWEWEYDDAGNIQSKKQYNRSTGALEDTVDYEYTDPDWGDLLMSYDGVDVTYDTIGNPAALNGRSYVWEHGRELRQVTYANTEWTNTYDVNGLRTKREGGGKTYSYIYNGSQLSRMTVGDDTLTFFYDASGNPLSLIHNGTTYYYATNLQGDVVAILNASGTAVVTYTYDAWGKLLSTGGTMATTLGVLNPLRYRGYVYDTETGLYYLQSRYYDPEVGRFVNEDSYISTGQGLFGNNMFAYCGNNAVNMLDSTGTRFRLNRCLAPDTPCASSPKEDESPSDFFENYLKHMARPRKDGHTFSVGYSGGSGIGGATGGKSGVISVDTSYNYAIQETTSTGTSTGGGGSIGLAFTYTNANSIRDLNGESVSYGATIVAATGISVDIIRFSAATDPSVSCWGISVVILFGGEVDIHASDNYTTTKTKIWNPFDWLRDLLYGG